MEQLKSRTSNLDPRTTVPETTLSEKRKKLFRAVNIKFLIIAIASSVFANKIFYHPNSDLKWRRPQVQFSLLQYLFVEKRLLKLKVTAIGLYEYKTVFLSKPPFVLTN